MTTLRRSFKLRYSIPPSASRSSDVRLWNCELRPIVACRDKKGT